MIFDLFWGRGSGPNRFLSKIIPKHGVKSGFWWKFDFFQFAILLYNFKSILNGAPLVHQNSPRGPGVKEIKARHFWKIRFLAWKCQLFLKFWFFDFSLKINWKNQPFLNFFIRGVCGVRSTPQQCIRYKVEFSNYFLRKNRKIKISKIVDTSGPKIRIFQNIPP